MAKRILFRKDANEVVFNGMQINYCGRSWPGGFRWKPTFSIPLEIWDAFNQLKGITAIQRSPRMVWILQNHRGSKNRPRRAIRPAIRMDEKPGRPGRPWQPFRHACLTGGGFE
jgi:hypothetical protein